MDLNTVIFPWRPSYLLDTKIDFAKKYIWVDYNVFLHKCKIKVLRSLLWFFCYFNLHLCKYFLCTFFLSSQHCNLMKRNLSTFSKCIWIISAKNVVRQSIAKLLLQFVRLLNKLHLLQHTFYLEAKEHL